LNIGNATQYLKWDGSALTVGGKIISASNLPDVVAGTSSSLAGVTESYTQQTSYTKIKEATIGRNGELTIAFNMGMELPGTGYAKIYRNGSAVGTEQSTTSGTDEMKTESISGWTAGDLVQIYAKVAVGTQRVRVRTWTIKWKDPLYGSIDSE
jgi:hypothetical protein